jgi:hypothetical protein
MAMNPAMRNPMTTGMRRTVPVTRGPNIVAAVITVVAIHPHIASVRRIAANFNHRSRWPNA